MIDNKLLPKLSQNLLEILNDEEYYDITIEVGSDPYVKVFRAHMVILNYRSSYFRRILSTNKKKNDETLTNIKLPNILPEIFQIVLSFENDAFLKLQKYCKDLISKEPSKIFNSPNYSSIPEKLLITLIQNDNLQIEEIQVWEYVIKWGLARNPELSSDPTSFSKDDFNTLKNTVQQCIPFIRFHNVASKEFLKKVKPYKKILPKELYNNLLEYFLDNDSKKSVLRITKENKVHSKNIGSKIITFQHAELISKWIDRLEITDKLTTLYEFKLLYRYSRDERNNSFNKFREICNNRSRTITVIKVKDSNEILGGYNPIEWKFNGNYGTFGNTKDSFIFSFGNNNIRNYILSRVKEETKAIYNGCYCGPSFNNDLYLYINIHNELKIGCIKSSYEKDFKEINNSCIEEYEVFQIV
ncbi:hypothetical protein RirG_171020 [Rhizophagus irregularis DAOM 197198w]|uniref:Kelch-like protein 17 n=1 Tax=Rhizophagus irregularis (strain DAOM 197198w) TaxID=1432141 RepID=A0A015M3P3_RHIIW|nr:hypothetical protein RirG_171020 [Rhizophagus irregularis DAOM 197198w]